MSKAHTPQQVTEALQTFVAQINTPLWVGYSGGLDSSVLLHALVQLRTTYPQLKLHAIHIHHGLQTNADAWQLFCQQQCQALQVPLTSVKVHIVEIARQGVEAAARQQRYVAFAKVIQNKGVLVTAHHQRDQVETVLMALARGAGVNGLGAMSALTIKRMQGVELQQARPLLQVPYESLKAYAQAFQLSWIEDPTNQQIDFKRNFVRHEILPKFNQAWSFSEQNIAKSARFLQEANELLLDLARLDIGDRLCSVYGLDLRILQGLSWPRQKNVVQFWFQEQLNRNLTQPLLQWLAETLPLRTWQSHPKFKLGGSWSLRIHGHYLYCLNEEDLARSYCLALEDVSQLKSAFPFDRLIDSRWLSALDMLDTVSFDENDLLRPLQKTEFNHFPGLTTWFKTQGIAPWLREIWPLIVHQDKPFAVLGFRGPCKSPN